MNFLENETNRKPAQLVCEGLSLGYENTLLLRDLSFTVREGDYLCIVGENGSGKSTLMRTLLHLQPPLTGPAALEGGIKPNEILVIHDDLDIEPGTIRVKVGGGHGGHNGLKSIHAKLQSNEYLRVKVGVGHPGGKKQVVDHVLNVPRGMEAEAFEQARIAAHAAVMCVIDEGPTKAMNQFN